MYTPWKCSDIAVFAEFTCMVLFSGSNRESPPCMVLFSGSNRESLARAGGTRDSGLCRHGSSHRHDRDGITGSDSESSSDSKLSWRAYSIFCNPSQWRRRPGPAVSQRRPGPAVSQRLGRCSGDTSHPSCSYPAGPTAGFSFVARPVMPIL